MPSHARVSARRLRRWLAWLAVCLIVAGVYASRADEPRPPDYPNAAAIADALNDGGLQCVFTEWPLPGSARMDSYGECVSDRFEATISVFRSADARENEERGSVAAGACDLGIKNPTFIRGERWLIGAVDPEVEVDDTTVWASDFARATGGELNRICD
jgi:hypothetical protein